MKKSTLQIKKEMFMLGIERYTEQAQNAISSYERDMYWDKVEAYETALYNIKEYGQVETPERIFDIDGVWLGYRLNNGTEVWNSGEPRI